MIYTYNPRTATVIVYLLPTGLALIYMHPNDKRRELCIQSKVERAEVEKWHKTRGPHLPSSLGRQLNQPREYPVVQSALKQE